jgi:MFS family permease
VVTLQSARGWGSRGLLALLFVINLLNYIDRLTISGLLEPIGRELHLSDAQLGIIGLAFLLPYSILPPIVGWIGDRGPRSRLIALAVSIWSMATGAAGAARNFLQLAASRAVVGVGEATYMSLAPSLIADAFPIGRRGSAMSFFYIASPVGAALGVFLSGLIASLYGWRTACFVVGIPGLVFAVAMWIYPEPARGGLDPEESPERPPLGEALRSLAGNRAYLLLTFAYTSQLFAYNPIEFWLPTILQRDKGIALAQANSTFGLLVLVAGILGPLLGGLLADRFALRSWAVYYWICVVTSLACLPPLLCFVLLPRGAGLYGAVFSEVFLANMSTGLVFTILVTIIVPGLRATATAVLLTVIHVLGDMISEPLIGKVSTHLQHAAAATAHAGAWLPASVSAQHLSQALFIVSAPAMALSGLLYMAAARYARAGRG